MGSGSISPGRYQPAKRAPLDDRYIRQLVLSQRKHLFISGAHAAAATAERIGIVCTGALARGVQPWVARAFRMRFLVALSRPVTGAHAGVCCAAAALLVCTACNLSSPIITGVQELPLCWDAASKDSIATRLPQSTGRKRSGTRQRRLTSRLSIWGRYPVQSSWHIARSVSGGRIEP